MRRRQSKPSATYHILGLDEPKLKEVAEIYNGSDRERTKALYDALGTTPLGIVATNLFRATKNSARAKVYRGGNGQGSYRDQAYDRKQWAMDNLAKVLVEHADGLGIKWGWQDDPVQEYHSMVLYVETEAGQVSFHTKDRGVGPDFGGKWDGKRGMSPEHMCRFVARAWVKALQGIFDRPCVICGNTKEEHCITDGANEDGSLRVFTFCSTAHMDQWEADNPIGRAA